jgi:hypothetical protein
MKRNQQKRPRILPERPVNGSKREDKAKPRERKDWMRDAELDRSINAAVQDGDYSAER